MPVSRSRKRLAERDDARRGAVDRRSSRARSSSTRILRSETFQQADRLKRFLTFVVTEAIAGRQAELKEYVIGVQVFRKEEEFRSAHRPDRARAGPAAAREARPVLPRRRPRRRADHRPAEGRLRAGVSAARHAGAAQAGGSARCSSAATPSWSSGSPTTARRASSVTSATRVRDELIHHLAQLPGLRILASRGEDASGELDDSARGAAVIVGGSVRQSGDRLRTDRASDRRREQLLPLVGVDRHGRASDAFVDAGARGRGRHQEAGAGVAHGPREWPGSARRRRISPRRISICRAATTSTSAPRRGCGRPSNSSRRRSPKGRSLRRPTADWPMPTACSRTTACSDRPTCGPRRRRAAASAVMLDDTCAEAHTSLAHVKATQDFDWKGAEREFLRAISLEPRLCHRPPLVRRCRAWRRSVVSTKRSTRCWRRSRSIRCRRSWRAIWR